MNPPAARGSVLIEACVDSVESAIAAERGGAGRLELCAALNDGGTTPSIGMIDAVTAAVAIPVAVIVRPRGGGFVYSAGEMAVMRRDIEVAIASGIDGLVVGVLRRDARIDADAMRELIDAAGTTPVACHRAFDLAVDLDEGLDALMALGVVRVLTSGGAPTAIEGADRIAALVRRAAGRVEIMAGGGIREDTVGPLIERSGVREVHVRGTRVSRTEMVADHVRARFRKPLLQDEWAWEETDPARIGALATAANRAADGAAG